MSVHRCHVQILVQISEITWEEFEKVGFANLWKKTVGGNVRGLLD